MAVVCTVAAPAATELRDFTFERGAGRAALQPAEFSLTLAWRDKNASARLVSVIREGILKNAPAAAEAVLGRLACLVREDLPDREILGALRGYLDSCGYGAKSDLSYRQDEALRVQRRVRQITDLFPEGGRPESLLDIGCGNGKITAALAAGLGIDAARAVGTDVYDRAQDTGGFTYRRMRNAKIPLPDNSVEAAVAFMTLHHEQDAAALLSDVSRVMKRGGILIVRDHDAPERSDQLFCHALDKLYFGLFNDMSGLPVPGNYRSCREWCRMAEAAGFRVEKAWNPEPDSPVKPFHAVFIKQ